MINPFFRKFRYSLLALISLLILVHGSKTWAHTPKEGDVYASLGPFLYETQLFRTQNGDYTSPRVGVGLLGEGDLSSAGGIEAGLFYIDKTYQRMFGNALVVAHVKKLEIPVGYRYWFFSWLSAAASLSSAFSIGDGSTVYSNVVNSDQSTSATMIAEYGWDFSVSGEVWSRGPCAAIIDVRYFDSLTANQGEDANRLGVFIAIKYLLQSKEGP